MQHDYHRCKITQTMENLGDFLCFSSGQIAKQQWDVNCWQVETKCSAQEGDALDISIKCLSLLVSKKDNPAEPMFTIVIDGAQSLRLNWLLSGHFTVRWIFLSEALDDVITCQDEIRLMPGSIITVLHQQQKVHSALDWQRTIHIASGSKMHWFSWVVDSGAITKDKLFLSLDEEDSVFTASVGQLLSGSVTSVKRKWHIIHQKPRTQSQVMVRSVLSNGAQLNDQCLVAVESTATDTDTQVYSHALLLDDLSKAQAAPELEVYCEDVNCRHGTTSGHLDEACMFYLASRGIEPSVSSSLMIGGFLAEVTAPWQARDISLDLDNKDR